jgi:hypothetical protein
MVDSRFSTSHAHLPWFVAGPGQTDVLLVVMGVFLILSLAGAHRSERAEDPISARCDVRTSCDVHSRKPVLDRRLAVGHDRFSRFRGPTKPNFELGRAHRFEGRTKQNGIVTVRTSAWIEAESCSATAT